MLFTEKTPVTQTWLDEALSHQQYYHGHCCLVIFFELSNRERVSANTRWESPFPPLRQYIFYWVLSLTAMKLSSKQLRNWFFCAVNPRNFMECRQCLKSQQRYSVHTSKYSQQHESLARDSWKESCSENSSCGKFGSDPITDWHW